MSNIPNTYLCPITYDIMIDPVIAPDGITYERINITNWINQHHNSPMTRQQMSTGSLVPNRALKELIEQFSNPSLVSANSYTTSVSVSDVPPVPSRVESNVVTKYIQSNFNNKVYVYTRTTPVVPTQDTRIPTTFICIIDVSGSMGALCSNKTGPESDGFSRLDLTKHSLNTVAEILTDNDELIIIKFSTTSECVFEGKMNSSNKNRAKSVIKNLKPENSTNIWGSIQMAYAYAKRASNENVKMLLLTDGESNMDPPMGIIPTLKKTLDSDQNTDIRDIPITTFGFSCDIDSKLLFDIAEMTNGGFNFIPDASMVGTSFINFLANSLATEYINHDVKLAENLTGSEHIYHITDIEPSELYELIRFHTYETLKKMCVDTNNKTRELTSNVKHSFDMLMDYLTNIIKMFKNSGHGLEYYHLIIELFKDFKSNDDNEEQIYKAISSNQWFKKWGYHYLLSLGRAHKIRKCHNFRDKGVQSYGGTQFDNLKDTTNDIFCSIQPPTPSVISYNDNYRSGSYIGGTQSVPVDMSSYVNSSGSCFAPSSLVKLENQKYKQLKDLNGSELLFIDESTSAKIKYISKTRVVESKADMCLINDLVITPWHPMFDPVQSKWVFPCDLVKPVATTIDYLYNIVLEDGYYVCINDIKCVTMGHNLTNFDSSNMILKHPYYGTNKVIEDLEAFKVGSEQVITLDNYVLVRDSNKLICKITNA